MRANESLAWLLDWSSVLLASISACHTFSPPGESLDGPTKISCRIGWYAVLCIHTNLAGRWLSWAQWNASCTQRRTCYLLLISFPVLQQCTSPERARRRDPRRSVRVSKPFERAIEVLLYEHLKKRRVEQQDGFVAANQCILQEQS